MSKPCRECKATGWEGAQAGKGHCRFCGGSGYVDQPRVDTPAKLRHRLRQQDAAAEAEGGGDDGG